MDGAVDLVLETTRNAYPSFDVPFHSRWRHFVTNGDDRWAAIADRTDWPDRAARARAEFDLAIVSVFLDAGAGPSWRYRDPKTGSAIGRSEGLGLASLAMFTGGAFSAAPLRAVARRCRRAREFWRCRPRARHAGLGCQSAGRDWTAAPTCCVAWAGWWPRNRKYSAAATRRGPAACSTGLRCWQTVESCPRRRF